MERGDGMDEQKERERERLSMEQVKWLIRSYIDHFIVSLFF